MTFIVYTILIIVGTFKEQYSRNTLVFDVILDTIHITIYVYWKPARARRNKSLVGKC